MRCRALTRRRTRRDRCMLHAPGCYRGRVDASVGYRRPEMGKGSSGRPRLPSRAGHRGPAADSAARYVEAARALAPEQLLHLVLREAEIQRQRSHVTEISARHDRTLPGGVHPSTLAELLAGAATAAWGSDEWMRLEPRTFKAYYMDVAVPLEARDGLDLDRWDIDILAKKDPALQAERVEIFSALLDTAASAPAVDHEARRRLTTLNGALHALLLDIPEEHLPLALRAGLLRARRGRRSRGSG